MVSPGYSLMERGEMNAGPVRLGIIDALDRPLGRYNERRAWLRGELQGHQPFFLFASLSFVVAAFLRGSTAAGLAAAAAIAFFTAAFFSIELDRTGIRGPRGLRGLTMILLFYGTLGYGGGLLAIVAVVIIVAVPGMVDGLVDGGIVLLGGVSFFALAEVIWRIRKRTRSKPVE